MKALRNDRTSPAHCSETIRLIVQYKLPVGAQWSFDQWVDMATFEDGHTASAEQYIAHRRCITPDFRFQIVRRTTKDVVVSLNKPGELICEPSAVSKYAPLDGSAPRGGKS